VRCYSSNLKRGFWKTCISFFVTIGINPITIDADSTINSDNEEKVELKPTRKENLFKKIMPKPRSRRKPKKKNNKKATSSLSTIEEVTEEGSSGPVSEISFSDISLDLSDEQNLSQQEQPIREIPLHEDEDTKEMNYPIEDTGNRKSKITFEKDKYEADYDFTDNYWLILRIQKEENKIQALYINDKNEVGLRKVDRLEDLEAQESMPYMEGVVKRDNAKPDSFELKKNDKTDSNVVFSFYESNLAPAQKRDNDEITILEKDIGMDDGSQLLAFGAFFYFGKIKFSNPLPTFLDEGINEGHYLFCRGTDQQNFSTTTISGDKSNYEELKTAYYKICEMFG